MTIDTRLVNARLVDSTGVHLRTLSIDNGRLIPDQETDDVWRTVDASGHLVIPGIIQAATAAGDAALVWAKRGATTAIARRKIQDAPQSEYASLDWVDAVVATNPSEFAHALKQGARVIEPRGLVASEAPLLDDPTVLRFDGEARVSDGWLANGAARFVVSASLPGALDLVEHERVVIEIPGPALLDGEPKDLWDLVNGDRRVLVTSGNDASFPLLQFLYHEGHVKRDTPITRIAELVSLNAAAVYGLDSKSGYEVGMDGDLVVFDPDADDPYLDAVWPGRVIFSLQRGNILLYNGELHTTPGDGRQAGVG